MPDFAGYLTCGFGLDNLPLDTAQTHVLPSSELCEMSCVICMIIPAGFRNSHEAWFQRKQQIPKLKPNKLKQIK